MQETAWRLGCRKSVFVEPTGLDPRNVATVREVVLLFREVLQHPDLADLLGTTRFTLTTRRGSWPIVHSSRMLRYRKEVVAAKTGYISEAGYCLAQYVQDEEGDYITVVLGAGSIRRRCQESLRLMNHIRRMREPRAQVPPADPDPLGSMSVPSGPDPRSSD
jgi:D-alanyl-D-alanine carboxypeptidase